MIHGIQFLLHFHCAFPLLLHGLHQEIRPAADVIGRIIDIVDVPGLLVHAFRNFADDFGSCLNGGKDPFQGCAGILYQRCPALHNFVPFLTALHCLFDFGLDVLDHLGNLLGGIL